MDETTRFFALFQAKKKNKFGRKRYSRAALPTPVLLCFPKKIPNSSKMKHKAAPVFDLDIHIAEKHRLQTHPGKAVFSPMQNQTPGFDFVKLCQCGIGKSTKRPSCVYS
ncbi:hypothetical protein FQA47_006657 [Oryzias melastigma]|uniref:Uncharacterized protein n=1 Tax=Oryzias melastigma TaxID=30732 RepID=A0A834C627_ORYME|nr:hypothetical protein FQA47_006657 [Oryzias melastigma]